ncbi:YwmB family TATA-box binding protein [Gracilibacillus marinus]|uniref:YwmB family TATA-box binding protein n=1 Tax=Gracilibacillus marinus TaxID=630535 RepID=A0ABV8VPZ2_9BACI
MNYLNKFYIGIIIFIITTTLLWRETLATSQTDVLQPIDDMYEAITEQQFKLKKWQLMIRENRTILDIHSFIGKLEGYKIKESTNEQGVKKYIAEDTHKEIEVSESIVIVAIDDKRYQIMYEISSSKYSKEVQKDYMEKINRTTNELFTDNAQYFSCIEALNDGIMDIVCLIKKLTKQLQIDTRNQLTDENFSTWTGYTPKWEQTIVMDDYKQNAHIAVKNTEDNQTELIIGTPILVIEY